MHIIDHFVKKSVLTTVLSIFLVFVGICAFFVLPLRYFPQVEMPIINIDTTYAGATQEVMQGFVTSVLQNALSGIRDVNYITATNTQGQSHIEVNMDIGSSTDLSLATVMNKVAAATYLLPKGAEQPVITSGGSSDLPVMVLAFTSQKLKREAIADILRRQIVPELEAVPGVAAATVLGGSYAMRIWLDPEKLLAYGIDVNEVVQGLQRQNLQSTIGSSNGKVLDFNLAVNSDLQTVDQFAHLIIKQNGTNIVYLQDVAKIELGANDDKIVAYFNDSSGVMMRITALANANPLVIAKQIHAKLPGVTQTLAPDITVNSVVDTSKFISAAINEVLMAIVAAVFIVCLVICVLLGSFRSAVIPIITIPITLIGTFAGLYLLGYSFNLLTLLALMLAIGLVVDDAIVVVENIHRHMELGSDRMVAALIGTKEIATAVIAMASTLVAVFMPLAFVAGITGQLFREFAFTLVIAVVLSGAVALSLVAMLAARMLRLNSKAKNLLEYLFLRFRTGYTESLQFFLRYYKLAVIGILAIILGIVALYRHTSKELAPLEDLGYLEVICSAPTATSTNFLATNGQAINQIMHRYPSIAAYEYVYGVPSFHQLLAEVSLKDWDKRQVSSLQLQSQLQGEFTELRDLQSYVLVPAALPGSSGLPLQFVIRSTASYEHLYQVAQAMLTAARQSGIFLFLKSDLAYDKPNFTINLNRAAASILGVQVDDITAVITALLSGNRVQQFTMAGRSYDVITQISQPQQMDLSKIKYLYVKANNGNLIPLANLVTFTTTVTPDSLNQFQKMNSVTLSGIVNPHYSLAAGIDFLTKQAKQIKAQNDVYDFAGESRQYLQEGNRMLLAFLLAAIVIFLVLAIQFESFLDPLIILLGSAPAAICGALCCLGLGFATLNIYTEIGLLALAGLISKHGILLVNQANQLMRQSTIAAKDAIVQAASLRLRPIIMTTAAMVFGALPLIFAGGPSSNSRFALGIVIIFGMLVGTLSTLYLVPALYVNARGCPSKLIHIKD